MSHVTYFRFIAHPRDVHIAATGFQFNRTLLKLDFQPTRFLIFVLPSAGFEPTTFVHCNTYWFSIITNHLTHSTISSISKYSFTGRDETFQLRMRIKVEVILTLNRVAMLDPQLFINTLQQYIYIYI
jgi:hypothetical protein